RIYAIKRWHFPEKSRTIYPYPRRLPVQPPRRLRCPFDTVRAGLRKVAQLEKCRFGGMYKKKNKVENFC
ncbi:MAG: hypothetical protein LUH06_04495, partial [Oscillospiraceae bacterium]|nr:hypothetical protein [Oscillospiraceae bacterium]